jgi:hypothetical protein
MTCVKHVALLGRALVAVEHVYEHGWMEGRRPISLTGLQVSGFPISVQPSIRAFVWVPYTDGQVDEIEAFIGERTSDAVHVRWLDSDGLHDVWVWAAAVHERRRQSA